jgi:hypothetical protein
VIASATDVVIAIATVVGTAIALWVAVREGKRRSTRLAVTQQETEDDDGTDVLEVAARNEGRLEATIASIQLRRRGRRGAVIADAPYDTTLTRSASAFRPRIKRGQKIPVHDAVEGMWRADPVAAAFITDGALKPRRVAAVVTLTVGRRYRSRRLTPQFPGWGEVAHQLPRASAADYRCWVQQARAPDFVGKLRTEPSINDVEFMLGVLDSIDRQAAAATEGTLAPKLCIPRSMVGQVFDFARLVGYSIGMDTYIGPPGPTFSDTVRLPNQQVLQDVQTKIIRTLDGPAGELKDLLADVSKRRAAADSRR